MRLGRWLLLLALAGCGEEVADLALEGGRIQGGRIQGGRIQGASLAGEFPRFSLSGMTLGPFRLDRARVTKGELRADLLKLADGEVSRACATGVMGAARDCDYQLAAGGTCAPGERVRIEAGTCGASESRSVRVCAGATMCQHASRLGEADDLCVRGQGIELTCPASGGFSVLAGDRKPQTVRPRYSGASFRAFRIVLGNPKPSPIFGTTLAGKELAGVQIPGVHQSGRAVMVRVRSVDDELAQYDAAYDAAARGGTYLYGLEYTDPATGKAAAVCDIDADGRSWAIPIAALWDARGDRTVDPKQFTMACTAGVLAKCYRWGYRPWYALPGGPQTTPSPMEEAHWTCSRMARADYCGDGQTHTREGTKIDLWDLLATPSGPIQARDKDFELAWGLSFEAGWNVRGARCFTHARWNTLPPDLCPNLDPNDNTCDSPEDAERIFHVKHLDASKYNIAP